MYSPKRYIGCSIYPYQTAFSVNTALGLIKYMEMETVPFKREGKAGSCLSQAQMVSPFLLLWECQVAASHCADVPLFIFQASSQSSFPMRQLPSTGSVLTQTEGCTAAAFLILRQRWGG